MSKAKKPRLEDRLSEAELHESTEPDGTMDAYRRQAAALDPRRQGEAQHIKDILPEVLEQIPDSSDE